MVGARAAVVAAVIAALVPAARASGAAPDASLAAQWLAGQQTTTGAFGSSTQPADSVAESIVALVAGGVSGEHVARALDLIAKDGPARAEVRATYAARIVLGLHAAGRDPRSFAGTDYVALIESRQNAVTGELDDGLYSHALAALGLAAATGSLPERVVAFIRANECPGGGLGHERGCLGGADADTTSMTIAALVAGGIDDPLLRRARAWLRSSQNDDGGFGLTPDAASNANSTGLAISALTALGDDVRAGAWAREGGGPLQALAELQMRTGAFRYTASLSKANLYATVQAIPGAARAAYPIEPGSPTRAPVDPTTRIEQPRVLATDPARTDATGVPNPRRRQSRAVSERAEAFRAISPDVPARPARTAPIAAGLASLALVGSAHALVWRRR